MASPHYDLTTAGGLQYLENTPFASSSVTKLAGGVSNFTFRLHLRAPHNGQPTFILKHAGPYVAIAKELPFPVERQMRICFSARACARPYRAQDTEVALLQRVHAALGNEGNVTVPAVHLFDRAASVIVMDDAGADITTLKQRMLARALPPALADEIGGTFGVWLAPLHAWGAGVTFDAPTAYAREMSAWVTYGRLVDTLNGKKTLAALQDPPFEVPEEKMRAVRAMAERQGREVLEAGEGLVMGDFWLGNILLRFADGDEGMQLKQILVMDWELAKEGLLGLDVGQFVAEVHLLARFHEERCKEPAERAISSFVRTYGAVTTFDPTLGRWRTLQAHTSERM